MPSVILFSQSAEAKTVPFVLRKALGCSITWEAIVVSQKTGNIDKVEYYDRMFRSAFKGDTRSAKAARSTIITGRWGTAIWMSRMRSRIGSSPVVSVSMAITGAFIIANRISESLEEFAISSYSTTGAGVLCGDLFMRVEGF